MITLFTLSCSAIEGHFLVRYNTLEQTGIGKLKVYEDFGRWQVGGRFQAELGGFGIRAGLIPTGKPISQTYEGFVNYRITEQITVGLVSWCKHYLAQSGNSPTKDKTGLDIKLKYEF